MGEWIKRERLKNGVGLRKLASALGVSPTYLSQTERGLTSTASDSFLMKVVEAFGAPCDLVFGLAGKVAPDMRSWVLTHSKMVRSLMDVPSARALSDGDAKSGG